MKNVVVIGGGHGQAVILKGLKQIKNIKISTIVTVADDGGSTGRIRERFNIPGMGDIRNCLVALGEDNTLASKLMNYRFLGKNEEDIIGHNLGNLILTATSDINGSFEKSIEAISMALNVKGSVIPSSLELITLYAKMDDNAIVKGETNIPSHNHTIVEVFYKDEVKANPKAIEAIINADLIILGVGSLYTSILPNVIIPGINHALNVTKAKKIYFANCMTQPKETYKYDLKDHIKALYKHGVSIDLIVKHTEMIPYEILDRYLKTGSEEVINNHNVEIPIIETELLDFSQGLVRHSPEKIRKAIEGLL